MSDVYTIDLDSLVLDTDVIELPEFLYASVEPAQRGYRGRAGDPGKRGKDGESIKGDPGNDGKSIDPLEVARLIDLTVTRQVDSAVARLPVPKDGKSADPLEVASLVNLKVAAAVSLIPRPKDGRNGKDADPKAIEAAARDAVARLPKPKDGKTVHSIGDKGDVGPNGWTPILAVEEAGTKAYLKIIDWFGGAREKPPIGYLGETGIVESRSDATNIRGPKGKAGEDGSGGGGRGKSAYQIALDNGFVGTEQEWLLSLKGDKGEDGTGGGGTPPISGSDGDDVIGTANINLSGHRVVRSIGTDDLVDYADSTNPAHAGNVIGITLNAANAGTIVLIRATGEVADPSFSFSPGPIYFDALGRLTQVRPTTGFMQQVAVASSLTEIVVQLGSPIILS